MSHLDDEKIALIAMGEPAGSDADTQHLVECESCAAEVADMSRVALVARSSVVEGDLEAPPADVWSRIHGELRLSDAVAADPAADPASVEAEPESESIPAPQSVSDPEPVSEPDAVDAERERHRNRTRIRSRRRSSASVWILAASMALVVAIGAGVWIARSLTPSSAVIASAELAAFPDHPDAVGQAEIDDDGDGRRTLTVTLEGDELADGDYREVWLIREDGQALISLGVLDDASGTFRVPDGVDLDEYRLVDISFEPVDGDPAHSGDSIVRGELDFA
ncbi:anti-sigma factor [Microbacterium foliorum]|uniref:Anti-sigma factor n=1 Tax=Microbacterium foliorum TaxID=104336 RepID=A0A4Y5YUQ3_9MICO|nr:anti-sigma factor [Microbacterium foliorum]QDE36248.1 anti-sigma factor [Microbacterium foliorum]